MSNSGLFSPFQKDGTLSVRNRIVMSAMTRNFADQNHQATDQINEYYRKRAEGGVGLILTEGVVIHPSADGYNNVPHIATKEQADSWSPVIDAVHAHGAKIACQLWHCGRISHSDYTGGLPPVSSTNVAAAGINRQNNKPFGQPVALDAAGIEQVYQYFEIAARNALAVGFDAIQLHCANGYLPDQFLDSRVNDRKDQYGGSVENRCRFTLELLERILAIAPSEKVIVRISPSRFMGEIYDWPDMEEMINYLLPAMWKLGLRNLDICCANANYFDTSARVVKLARPLWPGLLIAGASLTKPQAEQILADGDVDLITWGRMFISNPNFAEILRTDAEAVPFAYEMVKELI
jgi:N-ethylmaleimide reductase